jgi:hypothetical protein
MLASLLNFMIIAGGEGRVGHMRIYRTLLLVPKSVLVSFSREAEPTGCAYIYVYMCIYTYMHIYKLSMYIYMYREREREVKNFRKSI